MASGWNVASVGWAMIVLGWMVSPVISLLLTKILSSLGFDAKKKVRELELTIILDLENTLRSVDEARMLQRREVSNVAVLDKMAAMLRHAREDAEDIFNDAEEIEWRRNSSCWDILYGAVKVCTGIVWSGSARLVQWMRRNSCWKRLSGAVKAYITCVLWIALIVRSGSARLLQLTWRSLPPVLQAPVVVSVDIAASDKPVAVTVEIPATHEPVPVATNTVKASDEPVPVTASSDSSCSSSDSLCSSSGRCFSCLCSSFHFFINCSWSILCWIIAAIGVACTYRDWSYESVGITSYQQENAVVLDFLFTAISRRNLKKRIEKIESTVSEVKKSTLLGVARKSAPNDIASKNKSKIRPSNNRKVFGREVFRDSIMAKLRENPQGTSPCYSAIGIYGVAGSGKTTFARYTRDYIEEDCKEEKLFDTIMCIHVSEKFSVDDIFHEMLKVITKYGHSHISDRKELEEKLKESLSDKRFFLILDDLWVKNKSDTHLQELLSPLNVGKTGSKILVTARTKVAAGALCADEPMEMPGLDEDHYLLMFMHYALGGTNVVDEEFNQVGKVIAEKLHGSPIAAVIVAGQLEANRDIRFWKNIAEHDMLNDTMGALCWSYQQLSSDIRRCFEYCNIFPRRFKMKKGDLVHLWIAQGFVKTSCATEDMEDVAERYIQELVSCSFLQPEITWNDEEFFSIHDLLHELADMVTRTDCFRIENESNPRGESWKGDIPQDVRHIFIQHYDAELITKEILGFGNLRTLIINVVGTDTQVEEKVIDSICKKLPKLLVLAFAFSKKYDPIKEHRKFSVPEYVGQLKHLRYFAFRTKEVCIITLPSTLNKLQHIQVLDFGYGSIFEFTFAELVNFRHIFCLQGVKLPYVGRLSSLQTLPDFKVTNEQGCELKQLRDLNKLQGKIRISGLENVKSKGQALEANLNVKRLTQLMLEWVYSDNRMCSPEVEADVLEGLCPSAGLKKLVLLNFVGSSYPDWMVGKQNHGPKDLQELYLWTCRQPVPASGLAEAFPHLRVLKLSWCVWDALPDNMEHLASLKELEISRCKNIRSLPSLPQSLEKFTLFRGDDELLKSCQIVGHPNWQKIEHIRTKKISPPSYKVKERN